MTAPGAAPALHDTGPHTVYGLPQTPLFALSNARLTGFGFALVFAFVAALGCWAAFAGLSGALVGEAVLAQSGALAHVAHPTGGIIKAIHVTNGDVVDEGAHLANLDDTAARTTRDVLRAELLRAFATLDRLNAERDRAPTIAFRRALTAQADDPAVAALLRSERAILASRRAAQSADTAGRQDEIAALQREVDGLATQGEAKSREIALVERELLARDLVARARVSAREREAVRLRGERGALAARQATVRATIARLRIENLSVAQAALRDGLAERERIERRLARLTAQTAAANATVAAAKLTAPTRGVVDALTPLPLGGTLAAGTTLMTIVPISDHFVVIAQFAPTHIDAIRPGQPADVVLSGLPVGAVPRLKAVVRTVSAQILTPQDHDRPTLAVTLSLPESQVRRLTRATLTPGMPVKVILETKPRTVLDYLLEPLRKAATITFREP